MSTPDPSKHLRLLGTLFIVDNIFNFIGMYHHNQVFFPNQV
jgi:hypothetical protein